VRDAHEAFINRLPEPLRVDALVELNVLEQSRNVCRTNVAGDAWQRGQAVVVHGWVYGLHNGLLADLCFTVGAADDVAPAYDRALALLHQRWRERAAQAPAS
jgi:carbonic anhydrase